MEVFSATEIIFVVKKNFQTSFSPPKVLSPEEAEDMGPTTIGEQQFPLLPKDPMRPMLEARLGII